MTLLNDPEWAAWSDREIARRAGVGAPLVGDIRKAICNPITDTPRLVERNGTTYTQNTANIGRAVRAKHRMEATQNNSAAKEKIPQQHQEKGQAREKAATAVGVNGR